MRLVLLWALIAFAVDQLSKLAVVHGMNLKWKKVLFKSSAAY